MSVVSTRKTGRGELRVATRQELALVGDELFPELLSLVAKEGPKRGLEKFCKARMWDKAEVWSWVQGDEGRRGGYEAAKRYLAEMDVAETVEIADRSDNAQLKVDTRFRRASKYWRDVYGESNKVGGTGAMPVLNITIAVDSGAVTVDAEDAQVVT